MDFVQQLGNGVSRRGFMKGALAGAGAMTLSARFAFAEALLAGEKQLTAADVHGHGVKPGIVRINANENPLGPSPRAIEAVARHLFETNRYAFGIKLPAQLHKYHHISFGDAQLDLNDPRTWMALREKSRIQIGPGSGSLLQQLALLGIGNGDGEVIEATPGYSQISRTFESFKQAGHDTNAIRVPTRNFVHDLDAMKAAITPKTTMIAITNPNNPTGTVVPHDKLVKFVDSVPKRVIVLIDEAYIHFVRDPKNYQDAVELALTRDNVVVTRTFSKVFGLAGMRVGYLVTNKPLLEKLQLRIGFDSGITVLSSYAASAALDDHDFVRRAKKTVNDGKDYLYGEFDKMGVKYIPSQTNFMLVDVGKDTRKLVQQLRRRGVMIRSGGFSWGLPNYIRVSIGTPQELEVFVNEFRNVMGAAS